MKEAVNGGDLAAYKDVWVFCEQCDGQLSATSCELLGEGRRLADELGASLCGLLAGDGVQACVEQAGGCGADIVYVYDHPLLKEYVTQSYAKVVTQAVRDYKPEILLFGATDLGRDLAPRCAAALHTGLCADCTHLDIAMDGYIDYLRSGSALDVDGMSFESPLFDVNTNLKMTRPAFGGHLMATIVCPRFRPAMATVRPGVMRRGAFDEARARTVAVVRPAVSLTAQDIRTQVLEVVRSAEKTVDLIGADYIVAVGRGVSRDPQRGLALARALAQTLGGVVGGTRAAVDAGWLTPECQIGQTGKTVRPKIYIALGISGAIQHKAGMQDSDCIIAVNKNAGAPIFEVADYGICGDLFEAVPALIQALDAARTR